MGANSKIEWTHHTFNPWWGCARVSPGCEHCYAESFAKRTGHAVWGVGSERRLFGARHWDEPVKWNREAEAAGERRRVFCASMADVFEDRIDLLGERERLWSLIHGTPMLDWLMLTKRPQHIASMLPDGWGSTGWPNVWLGTTAENQRYWDQRVPILLRVPAVVRFVSVEPMLGPIDAHRQVDRFCGCPGRASSGPCDAYYYRAGCPNAPPRIDWIIVGGESGGGARAFDLSWARTIVAQCSRSHVPCFVKQFGAKAWDDHATWDGPRELHLVRLRDRKGGDPSEWPAELRVREFPLARLGA